MNFGKSQKTSWIVFILLLSLLSATRAHDVLMMFPIASNDQSLSSAAPSNDKNHLPATTNNDEILLPAQISFLAESGFVTGNVTLRPYDTRETEIESAMYCLKSHDRPTILVIINTALELVVDVKKPRIGYMCKLGIAGAKEFENPSSSSSSSNPHDNKGEECLKKVGKNSVKFNAPQSPGPYFAYYIIENEDGTENFLACAHIRVMSAEDLTYEITEMKKVKSVVVRAGGGGRTEVTSDAKDSKSTIDAVYTPPKDGLEVLIVGAQVDNTPTAVSRGKANTVMNKADNVQPEVAKKGIDQGLSPNGGSRKNEVSTTKDGSAKNSIENKKIGDAEILEDKKGASDSAQDPSDDDHDANNEESLGGAALDDKNMGSVGKNASAPSNNTGKTGAGKNGTAEEKDADGSFNHHVGYGNLSGLLLIALLSLLL